MDAALIILGWEWRCGWRRGGGGLLNEKLKHCLLSHILRQFHGDFNGSNKITCYAVMGNAFDVNGDFSYFAFDLNNDCM